MYFDEELEDDYENIFGEFEDKTELEQQIRSYHYATRRKNDNFELPSVDVVEQLVTYCITNQRFDEALDFCNLWIEYYPDSLEARNSLSYIFIALSRFRDAIAAADKVLEMAPNDTEGLLHKAMAFDGLGEPEISLGLLQNVLLISPDNEVAKCCIALTHKSLGNYTEALVFLEELIQDDPGTAEHYIQAASCYNDLQNFEKAIDYCQAAIDLSPYDENGWFNLGVTYMNQKKLEDAVEAFLMALSINEKFFQALSIIAKIYAELDNNYKSLEYFRQALILKPTDNDTLINYATVMAENGDFTQAINHLLMALRHTPMNFRAFFGLGICYYAAGNNKKSLEYLNRALKLRPSDKDILYIKADIFFSTQRYGEAAEIFETLHRQEKDNLMYLFSLGKCLYFEQNYEKAAECFVQMMQGTFITDDNRELISNAFFWSAKIFAQQENYDKSLTYLTVAFDLIEDRRLDYLLEFPDILGKKYSRFNKMLQKKEKNS